MTERDEWKKDQMKKFFSECNTNAERRAVFMMFVQDSSYHRADICQVLKELGINDDMSLKEK